MAYKKYKKKKKKGGFKLSDWDMYEIGRIKIRGNAFLHVYFNIKKDGTRFLHFVVKDSYGKLLLSTKFIRLNISYIELVDEFRRIFDESYLIIEEIEDALSGSDEEDVFDVEDEPPF